MKADDIRKKYADPQPDDEAVKAEMDALLKASRFDLGRPPGNLDYIFTIVDSGRSFSVGAPGMIGLIMGPEKSRKTNFLKAMVAAGLGGKPFLNINLDIELKRAAYFDTEQPEQYFWRTQSQSHYLAGLINNTEKYDAFSMRKWKSAGQRIAGIDRYLESNEEVGVVIIDGILDLVKNMNNETECSEVMEKLLFWSANSGAMILVVVHTSRGAKGMQKQAIGHIGAFLQRKCDFAIELSFDEKTGFTTVKHKLSRTLKFPDFEFTQNKDGYPILDHNQKVELPLELQEDYKGDDIPF